MLGDNGIDDWLLTPNELITVIHELIQEGSSIFGSLTTQFTDAISCLLKCRVVPLSENAFSGSRAGDTVHLGEWDTGVAGFHMTRTWGSTQDFVSVTHPNDFRIIEPYSYCKITLPFAGTFDFSLDELYGTNSLYFSCAYNASTGKIAYKLFRDNIDAGAGESKILAQFNGEFGMDVPVGAQEMSNPAGTIGAVASLASAILAPNPVSAGGAIAGTKQAFMGMQKTTSMVGGYGGNGGWPAKVQTDCRRSIRNRPRWSSGSTGCLCPERPSATSASSWSQKASPLPAVKPNGKRRPSTAFSPTKSTRGRHSCRRPTPWTSSPKPRRSTRARCPSTTIESEMKCLLT